MIRTVSKTELAGIRAVCIGGGTGVPVSIKALRLLGVHPDAVVSVADDGGSSGLLRTHTGQVPPGDLRKCLVALAAHPGGTWAKAFKTRFEYANDHTLGNLILTALQETTGSLTESIALCEKLLETCGHMYPSSLESVLLMGVTQDGQRLVGQSTLCKSETALSHVILEPGDAQANPDAVRAIKQADILVLGPGSLFTSIIPNLLIPGIRTAIEESSAITVFVCSLSDIQGETWGLNAAEHVEALLAHGLQDRLDYALVNKHDEPEKWGNVTGYFKAIGTEANIMSETDTKIKPVERPVVINDRIVSKIRKQGVRVLLREMRDSQQSSWHDPQALAQSLASILANARGL